MENKNIIIRLLQEQDIKLINAFHNRIYNDDRTSEKFSWEFFNAPAGNAIYVVAEDTGNNMIVGTQCAIPINLKSVGGQLILSAKSEDTLVDPDYRGMQLFEKMYDFLFENCKKKGIRYIWGFTPALKPFLKIGFEAPYYHHQSLIAIHILNSYKYISGLNPKNKSIDKLKIFGMTLLSKISQVKAGFQSSRIKNTDIKVTHKVSGDLDHLFMTINQKHDQLFHIHQDKNYINWRINNNPNHNKVLSYDFFIDNEYIANIIFNHHKDNVWYMIQATFNFNLSDNIKSRIIKTAVKALIKTEHVSLVRTWNFDTNEFHRMEIKIFKKAGFFYIPRGVHFVWKDLEGNKNLLAENFMLSRIATQGVI